MYKDLIKWTVKWTDANNTPQQVVQVQPYVLYVLAGTPTYDNTNKIQIGPTVLSLPADQKLTTNHIEAVIPVAENGLVQARNDSGMAVPTWQRIVYSIGQKLPFNLGRNIKDPWQVISGGGNCDCISLANAVTIVVMFAGIPGSTSVVAYIPSIEELDVAAVWDSYLNVVPNPNGPNVLPLVDVKQNGAELGENITQPVVAANTSINTFLVQNPNFALNFPSYDCAIAFKPSPTAGALQWVAIDKKGERNNFEATVVYTPPGMAPFYLPMGEPNIFDDADSVITIFASVAWYDSAQNMVSANTTFTTAKNSSRLDMFY
jgi:hypothetical protein